MPNSVSARRARPLAVAALAMLLGFSSIAAAPRGGFTPVGDPWEMLFDVGDGYYQQTHVPLACPANAIRGTVSFSRYGEPTTEFKPGVNVFLYARDGKKFVRLGFHADNFRPPFKPSLNAGPGPDEGFSNRRNFSARVGANGSFTFVITWTGSGTITAVTGNESQVNQLGERPDSIVISGFSGAASVVTETGHVRLSKDDPCLPMV